MLKLGIIGLSFKPGTDDLRFSPIVEVAEYFFGKGYQLLIYDENVRLSRLSGTNKDYIDLHIPHLANLITDSIYEVISKSEIIIINHNLDGLEKYIKEYSTKYFVDLVRVTDTRYENYDGICW